MLNTSRILSGISASLVLMGAIGLPGIREAVAQEANGPYAVFTVQPCRLLDTREIGSQGNILDPNEELNFNVWGELDGQGGEQDCGIPEGTTGVFVNIVAVEAQGGFNNHAKLFPFDSEEPDAAVISYEPNVFAIANGIMVPICVPVGSGECDSDLVLKNGPSASAHFVVDVTGYLAPAESAQQGPQRQPTPAQQGSQQQ